MNDTVRFPLDKMEQSELGMSNFDHSVDDGLAEALCANTNVFAQYSGWNFCGYVRYRDGMFECEVWQYGSPQEIIRADSLEDIMEQVPDEYGHS